MSHSEDYERTATLGMKAEPQVAKVARPTLFTMTIDTEEEWDWNAGWPVANLSLKNIANLPRFQDLCSRYGVATTYFTDKAVLDQTESRAIMLELARRPRVEIGMHIHPWNTPPIMKHGRVQARETFLHNLPPNLIAAKLNSVYERFSGLGLKPTSFRGGRYSSGGSVHDFLRDRGFLVDSSVVPFTTWKDAGAPDYRRRGLAPVRLAPRCPGELPLWEVPLTLAFSRRPFAFWGRCYNLVEYSWLSKLRLIGIVERLGLVHKAWLNFEQPLGMQMLPFLQQVRRLNLPCICFTVHSSSLMAGGNPYTPTPAYEKRIFARMEEVFRTIAGWPEFEPATMTEVALRLEKEHHARTGN
jgi:hypothetical protein